MKPVWLDRSPLRPSQEAVELFWETAPEFVDEGLHGRAEVDRGGRDVGVPEHDLDGPEADAVVEPASSCRMTKPVRGTRKPGRPEVTLDDMVKPPAREPVAPGVDEDRICRGLAAEEKRLEDAVGPVGEGNEAGLAALAAANQETVGSDVVMVESEEFGGPEPGSREDLEDGPVAWSEPWQGEEPI